MSRPPHSHVACNTSSHRHVPISSHQQHNNGSNYNSSNNNHLQNNNNNHVTRHDRGHNPSIRGSNNDTSAYLPSQRFQVGVGGGSGGLSGPSNHRQPSLPQLHQHHHLIQNVGNLQQSQHNGVTGPGFAKPLVQDRNFPLKILVQSDMVGAIIGRSGSTIKQITQQSKARIDVHREESQDQQEKVITMNGNPESCSAACYKIMEIIINERIQLSKGTSDQGIESNRELNELNIEPTNDDLLSAEVQLKILAHNNLIGRLIGRSGTSIKKIMEQTSTKINVSASSFNDCTHERTITVVGNLEQVCKAEQIISSKLRKAYLSDVSVSMQTVNQPPYLFNNLPYMPGPYAQNPILSTLVNAQPGSGPHPLSGRSMTGGGHQSHQIGGPAMYQGPTNYLSLYPNMSSGPGLLGFSPLPSLEVEKETVNIHIPDVMVGAIIGKSGSAIKEMILTSGASIRVAPATPTLSSSINNTDTATNESTTTKQAIQDKNSNTNSPTELAQEDGCQPVEVESVEASIPVNDTKPVVDKEEQIKEESTEVKKDESINQPLSASPKQIGNDNSPATRKVTIIGTPEAQWSAQYLIYRKVSLENKKSDISLMVEIQVPSQLVGRIIGKGGATVKQIQKQTRATIRLPDEKPTEPEGNSVTSVQIIGEFQCSQMAQRHIRNLMRDNHYSSSRQSKNDLSRHTRNNNNNSSTSSNTGCNNNSNNTGNNNNININNNNININNNIVESNPSKSNAQSNFIDNHRSDIENSSTPDEENGVKPIRSNEKSQGEIC